MVTSTSVAYMCQLSSTPAVFSCAIAAASLSSVYVHLRDWFLSVSHNPIVFGRAVLPLLVSLCEGLQRFIWVWCGVALGPGGAGVGAVISAWSYH